MLKLKSIEQELTDNSARNAIKGKFGQCKRRFGMDRIIARRKDCSETIITITILTANLIPLDAGAGMALLTLIPTLIFIARMPEIRCEYKAAA